MLPTTWVTEHESSLTVALLFPQVLTGALFAAITVLGVPLVVGLVLCWIVEEKRFVRIMKGLLTTILLLLLSLCSIITIMDEMQQSGNGGGHNKNVTLLSSSGAGDGGVDALSRSRRPGLAAIRDAKEMEKQYTIEKAVDDDEKRKLWAEMQRIDEQTAIDAKAARKARNKKSRFIDDDSD